MTFPSRNRLLELRLRYAFRGDEDRKDDTEWIVVPYGDDGGVRVLPVRDPLAFVDAIEAMVRGEVDAS